MYLTRVFRLEPWWPVLRGMLAGACLMLAAGQAGAADISGIWDVTEIDPLIAENEFFGRFRYEVEIRREGDGYVVHSLRTGARFGPAPLKGDRLTATGLDPNRGRARIDIRFIDGTRLDGTLDLSGTLRRLEGELDPERQLERADHSLSDAAAQARQAADAAAGARAAAVEAAADAEALRRENDDLRRRLAVSQAALDEARAAQQRTRVALRQPPPAPASRPAGPPAEPPVALEVIEPPLDPATQTARLSARDGAGPVVIGRVQAPAGLMLLRVNGTDVAATAEGIFRADLAPGTERVEVVAVDRNGARRTVAFALQAPPSAIAPIAAGGSLRERCYAAAVAAAEPDESALEICRAAVHEAPDLAINHYNLGVALSRLGRHAEALNAYQEAAGRWAR